MNTNLRLDRDILIPVAAAMLSTIGLCIVLWIGLRPAPEPAPVDEPTAPAFKFQLLATETHTPDLSLVTELPEDFFPEATTEPEVFLTEDSESFEDPGLSPTLAEDPEFFATDEPLDPTEEPELTEEPNLEEEDDLVFQAGVYDDTDYRIDYIGDWTSDLFTSGAYEETLSVSLSAGNTASFTFMGRQVVIGYLGSSEEDLGTAIVSIDGNPHQLDQGVGNNWTSPQLAFGEHIVVITHQAGDLLFLDHVDVR